jgi:DNA-binding CsgD family transcriptional regulator
MNVAAQFIQSHGHFPIDVVFDSLARIDGKPRLITDRNGLISAASAFAFDVIAQQPRLIIDGGYLRASDAHSALALKEVLDVPFATTHTVMLGEAGGADNLLLRASALGEIGVCLVLITATSWELRQAPELQANFGLTDSESQIVRDLFLGHSPQVIAQKRDSSIHTVRAHIRQSYQKLRVHTREQLLSKLLIYFV